MKRDRANATGIQKVSPLYHFFIVFLFVSMTLIIVSPAFGIKRIDVKHLFDMTANLNSATDVSVSKDGRIYVVDGVNHKIRIFNRNGKFLSSLGRKGSGNGEFKYPLGIDIDNSGKVYIADSGNHRLQIFSPEGKFIAKINIPSNDHHPSDPSDVAIDNTISTSNTHIFFSIFFSIYANCAGCQKGLPSINL